MPLYPYIPYLDPDLEERKKSFTGHPPADEEERENTNFQEENSWNPQRNKINKQPFSIPTKSVETYKRKLNESLRNFESKVNELLEDGLGGVDSICKRVHGLVDDNQRYSRNCTVNCAGVDTFGCFKNLHFPVPDAAKNFFNSEIEENHQKYHHSNTGKDTLVPKELKLKLKNKKETPRSFKATSLSEPAEDSDVGRDAIKLESPRVLSTMGEEPRRAVTEEAGLRGPEAAKERLCKIERDYQKVLENLDMVEMMMATVNGKVQQQKKIAGQIFQEAHKGKDQNKLEYSGGKSGDTKTKKKPVKPMKMKASNQKKNEERKDSQNESEEKEKTHIADEEIKQNLEETDERCACGKTKPKRRKVRRKTQKTTPTETPNKVETEKSLELDRLIDNAVRDLGDCALDSDAARSISDVSFATANADGASRFCDRVNSSTGYFSTSSSDEERFEISKSFQELKEFYEQNGKKREPRKKITRKRATKKESEWKNISLEEVHEETIDEKSTKEEEQEKAEFSKEDKEEILKCTDEIEKLLEQQAELWKKEEIIERDPVLDFNVERKTEKSCSVANLENISDTSIRTDEEISRCFFEDEESKDKGVSKEEASSKTPINEEEDSMLPDEETKQNTVEYAGYAECPEIEEENERDSRIQSQEYFETRDENFEEPTTDHEDVIAVEETQGKAQATEKIETEESNFQEIKRVVSNFTMYSNTSSSKETIATEENSVKATTNPVITPVNPLRQVSVQCRKLLGDLLEEEETKTPQEIAGDALDAPLASSSTAKLETPDAGSTNACIPEIDPELASITPEVHRKKASFDIHEKMEYQIRQTDSFDGFLNLMDKNKREQVIKQAERQDRWRFLMKNPLQMRHPFRVVIPPSYDCRGKAKKEYEKSRIKSLWFSPKDFKLRRGSGILNKRRMEMYCKSMHKTPTVAGKKCGDVEPSGDRVKEKGSNYSILVQSCTPLGRRPSTPRRWLQGQRPRIRHCDILDDLTLKDLAPFNAEYPREDEKHLNESVRGSFLYMLTCGEHKGDADGALMELVSPQLSCADTDCDLCKKNRAGNKQQKKPRRKPKRPRKTDDNPSATSTRTNLSPRAATQLLIQNIGEIKSKKYQADDNNPKPKRSLKDSIKQKLEDDLGKKIRLNQHHAPADYPHKREHERKLGGFEQIQRVLKIAELYPAMPKTTSNVHKLFPYINNPENRVFQNITVLPVMISYNAFEGGERQGSAEGRRRRNTPVNVTFLSEDDEMEVSKTRRPSTGGDGSSSRGLEDERRSGTSKIQATCDSKQNLHKFDNHPKSLESFRENKEAVYNKTKKMTRPYKEPTRRQRSKRSRSLGKATESENTGVPSMNKLPVNPNPWKPASRRPSTPKTPPLVKPPKQVRSKDRSNVQQITIQKVAFPKLKAQEKSSLEGPRQPFNKSQHSISKEKKPFRIKSIHDTGLEEITLQTPICKQQKYRPNSPNHKMMMDHLYMLRNRNTKLEGNIQKSIHIIEEKILDVLSTNDQHYKRKTMDRMEREINKVLKMINEQNCTVVKKEEDNSKTSRSTNDAHSNQTKEKSSRTEVKSAGLKMPRPPKRRAISRVLKFRSRQRPLGEEVSFNQRALPALFQINESLASDEDEKPISGQREGGKLEENENFEKQVELYPSHAAKGDEDEPPLCPVLRCPTPEKTLTELNEKTKEVMQKISREAFGRFADVLKTKTRLILDMTDRIDINDTNLLPSPRVASSIQAILARSKLPVITTARKSETADLMATTAIPLMGKRKSSFGRILNAGAEKATEPKTKILQLSVTRACRGVTGFDSFAWGRFGRSKTMVQCSSCSLKRNSYHDMAPFVRALRDIKASRFFEKRQHILPIEENSTNFDNFMGFLEGFSKLRETLKDEPVWNPEKESSFYNSTMFDETDSKMKTKATQEHSMIQLEEKPSEINVAIGNEKTKIEVKEKEETEVQTEINKCKKIELGLSDVQLLTIASSNIPNKKKKVDRINSMEFVLKVNTDRYSSILKFFYLFFYTMVFLCMNAMNFSC